MTTTRDIVDAPMLEGKHTLGGLSDRIARLPLTRFGLPWFIGVAISGLVALGGVAAAIWLLYRGVGVWGVNIPVAWGFAIANFVWWIGIGHAGTLISAILLLLRQSWRNSINRFAEAMTIFAVLNAGMFPLLHLGRYWKFYYLLPYPNQMTVWPQWRSPLVWDAFAVATYATVSVLFWYLGLIPDMAVARDSMRRPWQRRLCAVAALGWRGEARQWAALRCGYLILAGLATALVISVHSIVSLDFAVSIVPGWNPTVFPPYFVAGAIFSGMAMVLTLAIPLRSILHMKDLITVRHLDVMSKVTLVSGLIVAYGYITEMMTEWFSDAAAESYRLHARLIGHGALPFWTTIFCNVIVAQALWSRRVRTSPVVLFVISLFINLGMWVERYDIVVTSLERDYLPSAWRPYSATIFDYGLLFGTLGLFTLLFLLFVRILPISPIYELKELAHRAHKLDREEDAQNGVDRVPSDTPVAIEYASPDDVERAARSLVEAGHDSVHVYSPMPLEHLPEPLQKAPRWIPLTFLVGGICGGCGGYLLQYWAAVWRYPWIAGGKPLHSWPSFIPITYEMTILGASLSGLLAVLFACRLPRLHHPVFDIPGFERSTRHRFFIVSRAPIEERTSQTLPEPVAVTPWKEGAS